MRFPITVKGEAALRAELNRLKTKERPRIIRALAEAREKGDLRENAEYHAAREQQGFTEGRIKEIENKLAHAQTIDVTKIEPSGKVIFGVTVSLVDLDHDTPVRYQIVGEDEADIKAGKVSIASPLARALIGKRVADVVTVDTPSGVREFEIKRVQHLP